MKKPELLAPAGNLEKLKIAFIYGADAVFIGGKKFSLRARASNFEIKDIKDACDFAHGINKKVYVTTNILPHNDNIEGLVDYLKELENAGVDAIICASPVIIETAKEHTNLEVHISTQTSLTNYESVNFWYNEGVKRVVLARELSRNVELVVASQPTRGLDVGSIEFVYEKLLAKRSANRAILLISSELDEVLELADRIAVIYKGEIVGEVGPDVSREKLGLMMAGIK